jgi:hypothetical protein
MAPSAQIASSTTQATKTLWCFRGTLHRSGDWIPAPLAPDDDQASGNRVLDDAGVPTWEPVLAKFGEGARVNQAAHELFYYSGGVSDASAIQLPPIGLKIIAGDGYIFPSSGNGTDLDSADHQSHMTHPSGGAGQVERPVSHPIPILPVSNHFAFPLFPDQSDPAAKTSLGFRLASDRSNADDPRRLHNSGIGGPAR